MKMLTLMSLLVATTVATAQTEATAPATTTPAAAATETAAPVKKAKKAKKAAKPKAEMKAPVAPAAPAAMKTPAVMPATAMSTAAAANTTTTTQATQTAAPAKKWSGSVSVYAARSLDINAEENLDPADANARAEVSTITTLTGSYKLSEKDKVSVNQRFFRDTISNSNADSTTKIALGNMRAGYTRSTDATIMGSDKIALPFQVTVPTVLESRRDYAKIMDLRFIPDISWTLNPVISVGYSGFFAMYLNGNTALAADDSARYNGGEIMNNMKFYTVNSAYLSETANDSLSFFQSVGVSHGAKNHRVLFSATQYSYSLELSAGLTVSPSMVKGLSITADVTQTAPLQEGSSDILGKPIPYTSGIQLLNGAQSSYELTASYSF
jgi:hypothetical protein